MSNNTDKKKEQRKFASVEAQIIVVRGAVIVALVGLIGTGIIALVTWQSSLAPIRATQTAETQRAGATLTATFLPTDTPQPTLTPPQTPTHTITPTTTPTITATIEVFDVFDDFNNDSLDSSVWERSEGDATPNLNNGTLSINRDSDSDYINWMLFGQQNGKSIDTYETEVKIVDGSDWGSAGITTNIVSIENESWYVDFGISYTGDVFVNRSISGVGMMDTLGEWNLGDINIPHRLRIEWTGQEVRFFNDGEFLMSIPSNKPGYWAALFANADKGGSIYAEFNWVGWNYK